MSSEPSNPNSSLLISGIIGAVGLAALLGLVNMLGQPKLELTEAATSAHLRKAPAATGQRGEPTAVAAAEPAAGPVMAELAVVPEQDLTKLAELLEKPTAVPNEAVLTFNNPAALKRFLAEASRYGLRALLTLDKVNGVRVGFDELRSLNNYLLAKRGTSDAPGIEAHSWMTTPQLPKPAKANEGGSAPSGLSFLGAINAVGDRSAWGAGVTVAVLDTGIMAHPTFGDAQVTHVDLVQDGKAMHSHGTSVASLIAGEDDRVGGVAPGAHLLDIRVANDKGISVSSVLAQGIVEAVDRGAQVINISLGGYDESQLLQRAIEYAVGRKAIVVAAAGNDHYDKLAYPAAYNQVISVGSVDKNQRQAYFSNSGTGLDLAAPGVGLPVAWDTDKAASASGTSQSAAVVSGAVAYYLSIGVKPADIARRLQADAKATGAPQTQVGSGVLWIRR